MSLVKLAVFGVHYRELGPKERESYKKEKHILPHKKVRLNDISKKWLVFGKGRSYLDNK